jgi:hypothetical protein
MLKACGVLGVITGVAGIVTGNGYFITAGMILLFVYSYEARNPSDDRDHRRGGE